MNRKSSILLCSIFIFCFCFPLTSFGYSYLSKARWSLAKMPIPWYVTYSKSSSWRGRSKSQLEAMARKAFNTWENINCSFMMFRYMGTTPTGSNRGDGLNTIEWVATLPGSPKPSAIGLGGPLSRGGNIHEGNVWIKAMNRGDDFISTVIAHEVGHAIALGHSDVRPSIMYPSSSPGTKLTSDDKDGLCNAYPMSSNSCSEDEHCPAGLVCKEQVCSKCKSDNDCPDTKYCDKEICVDKCKTDADCEPKGRLCVEQRCTHCTSDTDCGDGRFCADALCQDKCKTDDDCQSDETCRSNGRCIRRGGCVENKDCKEGEFCQESQCVGKGKLGSLCQSAGTCDANQECLPHDCKEDLDCLKGFTCKAKKEGLGVCVDKDGGAASVCGLLCKGKDAVACPTGFLCKEYDAKTSYCYPEKRTPPKTEPGDKNKPKEGCGCSSVHEQGPDMGGLVLLFIWGLWIVHIRRRRSSL